MRIPKLYRDLIAAVRAYARGPAGDVSRGWVAIGEFWDDDAIIDTIFHHATPSDPIRTPERAIAALAIAAAKLDKEG